MRTRTESEIDTGVSTGVLETHHDDGFTGDLGTQDPGRFTWHDMETLEPRVFLSVAGLGESVNDHDSHSPEPTTVVAADDDHDDHDHDHDDDSPAHPDDPAKQSEHDALLDLVADEQVTHFTIHNGAWSSSLTWADVTGDGIGDLPGVNDHALVSHDTTVVYDLVSTDALYTLRIDGVLTFAHDQDTRLTVDTAVVTPGGTLIVGTEVQPIHDDVTAVIVIADTGAIDTEWDPFQLSRGLISHGSTTMYGSEKTSFVALDSVPARGSTELDLDQVPTNWQPGDRLVLTGTHNRKNWNEEFQIVSIDGDKVTIDSPIEFKHRVPNGEVSLYVANLSRNVVIISENPFDNAHRGHAMFMHSADVHIDNVGFYGLGRTDKRTHIDDVQFDDDGHVIEGTGLNVRGRYSAHFHRNQPDASNPNPASIRGSAVVDSPGWGIVNHDSHVIVEDNVVFDVVGSSFVTEDGSEIGAFRRNIAIRTTGSGDGLESREEIHDFGHNGHGFWFQGGGVEVVDNVAAGHNDSAFIFFTRSQVREFDAENLTNVDWANGKDSVSVGSVPIRKFEGNVAFASRTGFESWFHLLNAKHDGRSVVEDFTVWNTRGRGVHIPYTNQMTLVDVHAFSNEKSPSGTAVSRNNVTRNIEYIDMDLRGWKRGIDVARNGKNVIQDGYFNNIENIYITSGRSNTREVDINGDPQFGTLSDSALRGRSQYEIFLRSDFRVKDRDITRIFNPDVIRMGTVRINGKQLYYHEQASDFVPFKAGEAASYIPAELIGLTNQQIWDTYGIAIAGAVAPADAVQVDGINALVGDHTDYLTPLRLRSRKYTNQLENYQLIYNDADGNKVRDPDRVDLDEGWNLITREIDGQTRTFFVFGDVTAPEFVPDPSRPLVINPAAIKNGFTVKGLIADDSFGVKKIKKKFKGSELKALPIQTRDDGSSYILLEFDIKDRAGNVTKVALELTLDPDASLNPLGPPKDLPPREMSKSLIAMLSHYFDLTDDV